MIEIYLKAFIYFELNNWAIFLVIIKFIYKNTKKKNFKLYSLCFAFYSLLFTNFYFQISKTSVDKY